MSWLSEWRCVCVCVSWERLIAAEHANCTAPPRSPKTGGAGRGGAADWSSYLRMGSWSWGSRGSLRGRSCTQRTRLLEETAISHTIVSVIIGKYSSQSLKNTEISHYWKIQKSVIIEKYSHWKYLNIFVFKNGMCWKLSCSENHFTIWFFPSLLG